MRRHIALLLAVLTAVGTMTAPALAAEAEESEAVQETAQETPAPDPEGTVSWANLDRRIREGSLSALMLTENIAGIENLDYEQMREDLRKQLNDIAGAQWGLTLVGGSMAASSLDQAYDALRDTFDDLKDGEIQADNADVVWQLEDTVNQVVSGGETLYITLLDLEQQAADGRRGLDALDRSLEELRLREQLGQVSRQTVAEVEQTRASTVSQLNTLDSAISTYKLQLENLVGAAPTGEIQLGALPAPGEDGWEAPDYAADLEAAKAASWTLRDAKNTLDDAQEAWDDAQDDYRAPRKAYMLQQAEHTWNAAQLTYQSTVQSFETSFKSLYDSLASYEQALESAQSALTWQQTLLDTAQRKYELGLISRSDLLAAQDDAAAAQSAADGAWRDLFAARNSYRWAVETGLLSGTQG